MTETDDEERPVLTMEMLRAGIFEILREPPRGARVTVHHPRCPAVESGDPLKCRCMGTAFPA